MGDKVTQFIQQAFQKVGQVIVQSRVCFQPNFGEQKKLNKWFNFLFEEIDYVRRDLDPWRKSILSELVVDVYVGGEAASHVLLERWRFAFDPAAARSDTDLPGAYKRAIIMFRALFTQLRLLPAYKLYRDYRKNRVSAPALSYAFSEGVGSELSFASGETESFAFAPVLTPRGQLALSVEYVANVASSVPRAREDVSLHSMVINDYVTPPIPITGGPARSRGPSMLSQTPPHDMFTLEIGSPPLPPHPGSLAMSPQEYPLLFPQSPPPAFTLDVATATTPVPQSPGATGAVPIPQHTRAVLQVAPMSESPSSFSAPSTAIAVPSTTDGSPPFAIYGTTPHSMQQSGLFMQTPPLTSHMHRGLTPGERSLATATAAEHERRVVQLPARSPPSGNASLPVGKLHMVVPFKTSPNDSPASSPPTHGPLLLNRRRPGVGTDLPFAMSPERERARSSRGSTPGTTPRGDQDEELGSFITMLAQPAELKLFGDGASASLSVASFDLSRFHDARRAMQADVPAGPVAGSGTSSEEMMGDGEGE